MAAETDTDILETSAKKAADLAKDLRKGADQQAVATNAQHATAHKLEELSEDLAKSADEVKKNLKWKWDGRA